MRIGYYLSSFPDLSTTFIQREIRILRSLGIKPVLASNRPPIDGKFQPCDKDLLNQTFYLTPIRIGRYLKSNLAIFLKSPRRYIAALILAIRLKDKFRWQRSRNLARMSGACVLAEYFKAQRVTHVHVHFAFGAAGVAIFLGALCDMSYSLSIHGSDVLLPCPLIEEKLKRARFIVSNCNFHVKNLKQRFPVLSNQRFYIVRLGIESRSKIWSKIRPCSGGLPLRILNVARLHRVKGHNVLIRACARLHKNGILFQCKIVGDGYERRNIEALIDKLNLNAYVELLGAQYETRVAQLFEWCQVFVLSSLSEGTPMTVIEAMTKARTVVAPDITALPEMVLDGQTGFLFNCGSDSDLADKLVLLSQKPDLLHRFGHAGRIRAREQFDLTLNGKKLLTIYAKEIPSLKVQI